MELLKMAQNCSKLEVAAMNFLVSFSLLARAENISNRLKMAQNSSMPSGEQHEIGQRVRVAKKKLPPITLYMFLV